MGHSIEESKELQVELVDFLKDRNICPVVAIPALASLLGQAIELACDDLEQAQAEVSRVYQIMFATLGEHSTQGGKFRHG